MLFRSDSYAGTVGGGGGVREGNLELGSGGGCEERVGTSGGGGCEERVGISGAMMVVNNMKNRANMVEIFGFCSWR